MQAQSFQRYFVWGALAAVFVLILVQWDKDYGSKAVQQKQITQQTTTTHTENSNSERDWEDLPQVQQSSEPESVEQTSSQIIEVKTNTLKVLIDLKGGDIVHVELLKYTPDIEDTNQNLVLLENNSNRVYVAQSGLVGKNGPDGKAEGRPTYDSEQNSYQLAKKEKELKVSLFFQQTADIKIEKIFTLKKNSYLIQVDYVIHNQSSENWTANLFAQIKRDRTIDPYADTSLFAMKPFLGFAYWSEETKYNKIDLFDLKDEPLKVSHKGGWLAFVQHYFVSAWVAPTELHNTYSSRINGKGENIAGFTSESIQVAAGEQGKLHYAFYAGPKDQKTMALISDGLDLTVDYGWLWMIAQMIFNVMVFIQEYVGNWGWTIVLLTCLVKLLFFPLNQYAFKSMANMRKLQPKMQRLKEMYGEDRQKLSQATMEMYRKEKINPLGSCLPMLIQMPVFIALYWVLSESVEIRHSEFIFWIKDLSVKDPYFVLPGLMAVSMYIQQKLSPMVFQDPMQERIMKMMPFMFAIFFLFFPAGLVLYWLVNNILTIAQQWVINRKLDV